MIARRIHWLQDHLPRAARCQSGSLPIKSRYKYCRPCRFARTPLAGWPFPACCQISHVSSHLELPACLGCAARRPASLVSGSLGVQGAVHARAEIGAWLWGRRAAWASIVPAFYDCRRAMSTLAHDDGAGLGSLGEALGTERRRLMGKPGRGHWGWVAAQSWMKR